MTARTFWKHIATASLALGAAFALSACDWYQAAFLDSFPLHGDPSKNPDVYVYLGVDGLSYHATKMAMDEGAFSGPSWRRSKFISMFPATSDASWTRIMRSAPLSGHEFEYYHPKENKIQKDGLLGLIEHIMPSPAEFINPGPAYMKSFDHWATGYTHSLSAYQEPFPSIANTMNDLFVKLEGRAESKSSFSAYMLEIDVLGHMQSERDVVNMLHKLSRRIESFKAKHPERRFHFTLLSDHGMDYVKVPGNNLIDMQDAIEAQNKSGDPSLQLTAVEGSLPQASSASAPYVLPISHTRVSYIDLHTHPDTVEEVARRVSHFESVDLTVGRIAVPPTDPMVAKTLTWFGVWSAGKRILYFGFDPASDEYYLPSDLIDSSLDYSKFGFDPGFTAWEDFKVLKDEQLFAATAHRGYPDLFYRIRTGLTQVGVAYPPQVIVSFKLGYASMGFKAPGGSNEIATAGFHGALHDLSSLGTLLSEERDLPEAVRADTFLDLFPRMRRHIEQNGGQVHEPEQNASLAY